MSIKELYARSPKSTFTRTISSTSTNPTSTASTIATQSPRHQSTSGKRCYNVEDAVNRLLLACQKIHRNCRSDDPIAEWSKMSALLTLSFFDHACIDRFYFFMGFKIRLLPTTGTTLQPDRRCSDFIAAVGATRLQEKQVNSRS